MFKQLRASIASVVWFTVLFGLVFPLGITVIAQALFHDQAMGSLVYSKDGKTVIGSKLIGQPFAKDYYFQPRPSAAGNGYDPTQSSPTNLGPTSDKLLNGVHPKLPNGKPDVNNPNNFDGIKDLASEYRTANGMAPDAPVPPDAVTRSASGLDPEISPANAQLQAGRVAKARGIGVDQVQKLVTDYTQGRQFGFFGEPRVNVLQLNLALDDLAPVKAAKPAK